MDGQWPTIPAHEAAQTTPAPDMDSISWSFDSLVLTTAAAMKSPPIFLDLAWETRDQICKYLLIAERDFRPRVLVAITTEEVFWSQKLPEIYIDNICERPNLCWQQSDTVQHEYVPVQQLLWSWRPFSTDHRAYKKKNYLAINSYLAAAKRLTPKAYPQYYPTPHKYSNPPHYKF
ncbi:hypothetical protein Vi05172_g6624 [Venturia inaequalis]|nr:hypothetical protein Vi05172_g6624 [Venturia inaequalis]